MTTNMQAHRIAEHIMSGGGATFNDSGLLQYLKGYQVAVPGDGWAHSPWESQPVTLEDVIRDVQDYSEIHADRLKAGYDLGAWMHEGVLYLDVTRHYVDRDEAIRTAESMGELAVWDWAAMSEILLQNRTAVTA